MESMKRSGWLWFAISLATIAIAVGRESARRSEDHSGKRDKSELQKLKSDWIAGRVLERVSLPMFGKKQCVDIVYDERQAKFGFFSTDERFIHLDVHS